MQGTDLQCARGYHLVWVYPGKLDAALDSATWVKTSRELGRMDWRVTLLSSDQGNTNSIKGVERIKLSCPDYYLVNYLIFHLKFISFMLKEWFSTDVVFFHQKTLPWVFLLYLYRRLRNRVGPFFVMDTRTLPMEDKARANWRDLLRGAFGLWMNSAANIWADGQTTITQRMADKLKIPPGKLLGVWPSGADFSQFEGARADRKWPEADEPVCLTYIGVLHSERNLLTMCKAVEEANTLGMQFDFTLTGDGTQRLELEKYAQMTSGRIRINRPVPHDQVAGILGQAHLGVLPFPDLPKYQVSSPIKLFEYLAAGLPVLATRTSCHTDVAGDSGYVFWAEDASLDGLIEALKNIWDARGRLKELGKEAISASKAWTWEESARKLTIALQLGLSMRKGHTAIYPYRTFEQ
ncbi:MAG: glycosyltransferase [Anaerolineaceae bacterium]|nr:glycosyltransferase [Anaerolineaceae bacterium]